MVETTVEVTVRPGSDGEHALWSLTLDLAAILHGLPWTVVGAQMVFLHAVENEAPVGRASADVDFLVDVRAVTDAIEDASRRLLAAGFEQVQQSIDGQGMSFIRGGLAVDVLAPDNLGDRANLSTANGARTLGIPGGSQALHRTESVLVRLDDRAALVPRPNLAGAILLKSRAVGVSQDPDKHRGDLCGLFGMVKDPELLRTEMTRIERGWVKRRTELVDPGHRAWTTATNPEDAYLAFRHVVD